MIKTWDDILDLDIDWRNLLLGNGFSCNIWHKYSYASLLKYSQEHRIKPTLNKDILQIFDNLNTSNFEDVLKALTLTAIVKEAIDEDTDEVLALYDNVRNNLFNTVHATHISYEDLNKELIGQELAKFNKVFTTCYDLIPYWSTYFEIPESMQVDFFWNSNGFDPYDTEVFYPSRKTAFYYLHGALHLQTNLSGETVKIKGTSKSLPNGNNYSDLDTKFPLFITEGTSKYKLRKIQSNSYLNFCLKELSSFSGNMVILGQGLTPEFDEHLINAISNNPDIDNLAISIYSGLNARDKKKTIKGYEERFSNSKAELYFFESDTHPLCSIDVSSN